MTIYISIFAIGVFVFGLYSAVTAVLNWKHARKIYKETKVVTDGDKVSVIIPARNEENNLPRLLESMTKQDYRNFEVIVIDDDSTDNTWNIISDYMKRDSRIRGFRTEPGLKLVPNGKMNALLQAISHATGDYLYCTDADTVHGPSAISYSYSIMTERNADLISGIPMEVCDSFFASSAVSTMYYSALFVPHYLEEWHPVKAFAGAIGQFIMMRRSAYDECGGYAAIGGEICDDMSISRVFARRDKKVLAVPVADHVACHMYHSGVEGFYGISRSIYGTIPTTLAALPVIAIVLVLFLHIVAAPIFTFIPYFWNISPLMLTLQTLGWIMFYFAWFITSRSLNSTVGISMSYALGLLMILSMYLYAFIQKRLGHKFIWKDRVIGE